MNYAEALKFDHDLVGVGNLKIESLVMRQVLFHTLITF